MASINLRNIVKSFGETNEGKAIIAKSNIKHGRYTKDKLAQRKKEDAGGISQVPGLYGGGMC